AAAHRIGGRACEPHADLLAGGAQALAGAFRKQDVPGRHGPDAGLAESRSERLAGLAEADEAEFRTVPQRHASSRNFFSPPWSKRSTSTPTPTWVPSPTRSFSSCASTRNAILRPSMPVPSAVARSRMPTGVAA